MEPGAALWGFVERCGRAATISELSESFLSEMSRLGFPHVALASHVDPLRPPTGAVMVLRYPTSWVEHFSAEQYQRFDPVFEAAKRRPTPFHWDDQHFLSGLSKPQRRVLNEASEAGVAHGFTIPIRGPDALPASCSLVPDKGGVDPRHYRLAHTMAVLVHESARRMSAALIVTPTAHLTMRERQCLTLVARGKSDWAISKIIGVSERAVRGAIERAKKRLGVATRTQAIVRSLYSGDLSLYDAMD